MDFNIPHDLGRDEAKRRIVVGLPKLEQHLPGGGTLSAEWPGDYDLAMTITAMGQTIPVRLAIEAARIAGTVEVPVFLRLMSDQIAGFVKTSAQKMLDKS